MCFCFLGGVIQCVGGVIKTGVFEESRKAVKNNEIHCYFLFNLITFPVRALLCRSPQSVSGREGVPKELSEPMARRIRGSGCWTLPNLFPGESAPKEPFRSHGASYSGLRFVAFPQSVSRRENAAKELSEVRARRTRGSAPWPPPTLLEVERVR